VFCRNFNAYMPENANNSAVEESLSEAQKPYITGVKPRRGTKREHKSGVRAATADILALLINAQIARETSNDNRAASGHEAFAGME
jgi:hypothetical protein